MCLAVLLTMLIFIDRKKSTLVQILLLIHFIVFAHPGEEVSGRFGGHAFANFLGRIITAEPGFEAIFGYHIIVVEAIKDIGQQFCKKNIF